MQAAAAMQERGRALAAARQAAGVQQDAALQAQAAQLRAVHLQLLVEQKAGWEARLHAISSENEGLPERMAMAEQEVGWGTGGGGSAHVRRALFCRPLCASGRVRGLLWWACCRTGGPITVAAWRAAGHAPSQ
jgi:hypothetical protein